MIFEATPLKGCYLVSLEPFRDERGWFARTYCEKEFAAIGHEGNWVQLNHSFTKAKGTVRGLHFQWPPHGEIKLVRCIAGAVWDVVVDIRQGSPTFLQSFAAELSAVNQKMIYIPAGLAHGFQALTGNSELIYHHSVSYQPGVEGGLRYNDPLVNINWPLPPEHLSARDQEHPLLTTDFKGI